MRGLFEVTFVRCSFLKQSHIWYLHLLIIHDDVIKWKHFPRNWPFVRGIHRSRWIPHTKASDAELLMFSLICARINGWVNNGEAGDLRRHHAHYDVNVMISLHNYFYEGNVYITGYRHLLKSQLLAKALNTLRPRQHGCHFADDAFIWISLNENVCISFKISLKFVPYGPINKIPALIQITTWCQLGNKPLSEPMMVRLPLQIYCTRPEWINEFKLDLRPKVFK